MRERSKATSGLNPLEAIQLVALGMGSLKDYGLADDEKNRKTVDDLKREYSEALEQGYWVDVIA